MHRPFVLSLVMVLSLSCTRGNSSDAEPTVDQFIQSKLKTDDLVPDAAQASIYIPPTSSSEPFSVDCSKPSLAIVGGQRVTAANSIALSTVKILFTYKGSCTGTLIGPTLVLTAAHCMEGAKDPAQLSLALGPEGTAIAIGIAEFVVHPDYKGLEGLKNEDHQSLNDLALIRLSKPVPAPYRPVAIAQPLSFQIGDRLITAGYGTLAEKDVLARPLSAVVTKLLKVSPDLNEIQLETGTGVGPCYGDSGGPTYKIDPTADSCLQLVGVTTGPGRGKDFLCDEGSGTLMDVSRFQDWIQNSINGFSASAPALDR